ncbi:MAG: alpha/beta hydrolase [Acidobacteria bacterium]|nr:alpha/beta hydrolase [Acidobacteriota bacterium]
MRKKRFASFVLLVLFSLSLTSLTLGIEKSADFKTGKVIYNVEGDGAKTLVFIHGWTCNKDFWAKQVEYFKSGFKVISLDLPGHGKSDKPEISYDMNLYADSIKAVMDQEKTEKAILIGHSMGVVVVRQFYRRYPERTAGLVMVDFYLRFNIDTQMEQNRETLVQNFKKKDNEEFIRMFISSMFVTESPADLKEWIIKEMLSAPDYVRASSIENMFQKEVWIDDKIKVPLLLIRTDAPDPDNNTSEELAEIAGDSKLEILKGVGHFMQLESPVQFNQALMKFFEEYGLLK